MPRNWIYYIALVIPLVFRVLLLNTGFLEWLWYQGYQDAYGVLNNLRGHPGFLGFVGGWALPFFIGTVFLYWISDDDGDDHGSQFLILPILYVPFAIIGTVLVNQSFDAMTLVSYPLIIIPCGYIYVFPWVIFVWTFSKLQMLV